MHRADIGGGEGVGQYHDANTASHQSSQPGHPRLAWDEIGRNDQQFLAGLFADTAELGQQMPSWRPVPG